MKTYKIHHGFTEVGRKEDVCLVFGEKSFVSTVKYVDMLEVCGNEAETIFEVLYARLPLVTFQILVKKMMNAYSEANVVFSYKGNVQAHTLEPKS